VHVGGHAIAILKGDDVASLEPDDLAGEPDIALAKAVDDLLDRLVGLESEADRATVPGAGNCDEAGCRPIVRPAEPLSLDQ
jgi:hypothetical protein